MLHISVPPGPCDSVVVVLAQGQVSEINAQPGVASSRWPRGPLPYWNKIGCGHKSASSRNNIRGAWKADCWARTANGYIADRFPRLTSWTAVLCPADVRVARGCQHPGTLPPWRTLWARRGRPIDGHSVMHVPCQDSCQAVGLHECHCHGHALAMEAAGARITLLRTRLEYGVMRARN